MQVLERLGALLSRSRNPRVQPTRAASCAPEEPEQTLPRDLFELLYSKEHLGEVRLISSHFLPKESSYLKKWRLHSFEKHVTRLVIIILMENVFGS